MPAASTQTQSRTHKAPHATTQYTPILATSHLLPYKLSPTNKKAVFTPINRTIITQF